MPDSKKALQSNSRSSRKVAFVGVALASFLFGFLTDYFLETSYYHGKRVPAHPHYQAEERERGKYQFINPLLACDAGESIENPLGISKFDIQKIIDAELASGRVSHISVYFRDLNNGPWVGINEKEEFVAASLMKVPLMITYLKEAEADPGLLSRKIIFQDRKIPDLSQVFPVSRKLELGKEYSVWELVEFMIRYSDNDAANLLSESMASDKILKTFSALGMGLPDFNKPYPVSVKTYGGFFRILFNASYLTREMSEKALQLLASTEFGEGIVKDMPQGLVIAHKHGIREIDASTGKQLHDCGIIYYPDHPYLLCVMTRGRDFNALARVIQTISKEVYQDVSKGI